MTEDLTISFLRELSERLTYLRNLESRKEEVKSLIESGGNLSDKIVQDLLNAKTLAEVEDIYRPFKPKRKTRAGIAKRKRTSAPCRFYNRSDARFSHCRSREIYK